MYNQHPDANLSSLDGGRRGARRGMSSDEIFNESLQYLQNLSINNLEPISKYSVNRATCSYSEQNWAFIMSELISFFENNTSKFEVAQEGLAIQFEFEKDILDEDD